MAAAGTTLDLERGAAVGDGVPGAVGSGMPGGGDAVDVEAVAADDESGADAGSSPRGFGPPKGGGGAGGWCRELG